MKLSDASLRQIEAAHPTRSTWLAANAGSGKTRVLTDRVARLLLNGVMPQNILCLTYTKAAASEMQNRLFRRLGRWTMLDEAKLLEELAALGVKSNLKSADIKRARTLFARAVEAPGGLKIQTIHSFCASILRRFPLRWSKPIRKSCACRSDPWIPPCSSTPCGKGSGSRWPSPPPFSWWRLSPGWASGCSRP